MDTFLPKCVKFSHKRYYKDFQPEEDNSQSEEDNSQSEEDLEDIIFGINMSFATSVTIMTIICILLSANRVVNRDDALYTLAVFVILDLIVIYRPILLPTKSVSSTKSGYFVTDPNIIAPNIHFLCKGYNINKNNKDFTKTEYIIALNDGTTPLNKLGEIRNSKFYPNHKNYARNVLFGHYCQYVKQHNLESHFTKRLQFVESSKYLDNNGQPTWILVSNDLTLYQTRSTIKETSNK